MISPRAALFDLDGTLVRTFIDFPAMRRAMHDLSARYRAAAATQNETDVLEIVRVMADTLVGEAGETARREAYAVLEHMEADGCAHPEAIPGATELLRDLRLRGVRVGIVTRNCRRVSEDLLRRMSLEHDILVAREDTTAFKPHPEPVLFACRALNVAPGEAVMVGDLWADIVAGKAAGVGATVGIQWAHDPPDRFAQCLPDFTVASLAHAAALLLPADG